jgi:vacuolar-type H+-ATPase subunit I/STV1
LVIIAILLISLTAISLFFFQKETERRKVAEATLEEFRAERGKLEENLKEIKKQNFLLHEKNKEADDRINDLSDELELEKGLREAMKTETDSMKKEIEEAKTIKAKFTEEIKKKEDAQAKLAEELTASEEKIKTLEAKLQEEIDRSQEIGKLYEQQKDEIARMESAQASKAADQNAGMSSGSTPENILEAGIELEEIIVAAGKNRDSEQDNITTGRLLEDTVGPPAPAIEGRILSVDTETEFVIVSLGETHGVDVGDVLSVYRGENYIGDIRVTRLQPEMSAADLVPPFTVRSVKKNDLVKIK